MSTALECHPGGRKSGREMQERKPDPLSPEDRQCVPSPCLPIRTRPLWARCIVTITYWAWGLLRTPMPVMRSFAIARRSEPRSAPPSWGTPHPGTRSPPRRYRPISAANGRLELPLGRRSAVDIKSSEEERRDDKGDTHDTANYRSLHRI